MEILTQANGAKVFVDYAHNGDSLDKLLQVVTDHQKGKISLILGAPGNKGESRRQDFGHVLNTYPEINVILSTDDPNKEDPLLSVKKLLVISIVRFVSLLIERKPSKQPCLKPQDQAMPLLSPVRELMPFKLWMVNALIMLVILKSLRNICKQITQKPIEMMIFISIGFFTIETLVFT